MVNTKIGKLDSILEAGLRSFKNNITKDGFSNNLSRLSQSNTSRIVNNAVTNVYLWRVHLWGDTNNKVGA